MHDVNRIGAANDSRFPHGCACRNDNPFHSGAVVPKSGFVIPKRGILLSAVTSPYPGAAPLPMDSSLTSITTRRTVGARFYESLKAADVHPAERSQLTNQFFPRISRGILPSPGCMWCGRTPCLGSRWAASPDMFVNNHRSHLLGRNSYA